ncbi:hypothetical protein QQ045_020748 [Rhodiola kirilowii]
MSAEPHEVVKSRNGDSHGTNFPDSSELLYGTQSLPREFKIDVSSLDSPPNDICLVMVIDIDGSEPLEFNLYIGGGMGRTQRVDSTFPRLVEPLGHISTEDILYNAKAIVVTQRENRKRDDCKYSRMEYLIDSWGIDKFRSEVDKYYGKTFKPFCQLPSWEFKSYLGWHEQGDVGLFCGLHVDSGRMKGHMRRTLREVTEKNNISICLTQPKYQFGCAGRFVGA